MKSVGSTGLEGLEILLLRLPWDLAYPFVLGGLRALQGPLIAVPNQRARHRPAAMELLSLLNGARPEARALADEIPSLDPTLVLMPLDAPQLTVVETPLVLGLGAVLSALMPRQTVVQIDTRGRRADLRLWQAGIATPMAATPVATLLAELDCDAQRLLLQRDFGRSMELRPLLAQPAEATAVPETGHEALTRQARSLGYGPKADPGTILRANAAETAALAQIQDLADSFTRRLPDMVQLDALAARLSRLKKELEAFGPAHVLPWRRMLELALARARQIDPAHPAIAHLEQEYRAALQGATQPD